MSTTSASLFTSEPATHPLSSSGDTCLLSSPTEPPSQPAQCLAPLPYPRAERRWKPWYMSLLPEHDDFVPSIQSQPRSQPPNTPADSIDFDEASRPFHFEERMLRKLLPALPRLETFKRHESEPRTRLYPTEQARVLGTRRALSVDRRPSWRPAGFPAEEPSNKSPVKPSPRVPLPQTQTVPLALQTEPQPPGGSDDLPAAEQSLAQTHLQTMDLPQQLAHCSEPPSSPPPEDPLAGMDSRWILNLSMHFRDNSPREKFFVTYAQTPTCWRRVTVSCDYNSPPPGSLERDLQRLAYQRDKSEHIYEALAASLPAIQFYDTVTNLRLQTSVDDRLHVYVTEDIDEYEKSPEMTEFQDLSRSRRGLEEVKPKVFYTGTAQMTEADSQYVYRVNFNSILSLELVDHYVKDTGVPVAAAPNITAREATILHNFDNGETAMCNLKLFILPRSMHSNPSTCSVRKDEDRTMIGTGVALATLERSAQSLKKAETKVEHNKQRIFVFRIRVDNGPTEEKSLGTHPTLWGQHAMTSMDHVAQKALLSIEFQNVASSSSEIEAVHEHTQDSQISARPHNAMANLRLRSTDGRHRHPLGVQSQTIPGKLRSLKDWRALGADKFLRFHSEAGGYHWGCYEPVNVVIRTTSQSQDGRQDNLRPRPRRLRIRRAALFAVTALASIPTAVAFPRAAVLGAARIFSGALGAGAGSAIVYLRPDSRTTLSLTVTLYVLWGLAAGVYVLMQFLRVRSRNQYVFITAAFAILFVGHFTQGLAEAVDSITVLGPFALVLGAYLVGLCYQPTLAGREGNQDDDLAHNIVAAMA